MDNNKNNEDERSFIWNQINDTVNNVITSDDNFKMVALIAQHYTTNSLTLQN